MAETRNLVCVNCPLGCLLTAVVDVGAVTEVLGNQCARGVAYAEAECVNPTRMVTSTVPVENAAAAVLPVKTRTAIPKDRIMACMEQLRDVTARAPIAVGEVVLADVAGTGVDVVASRSLEEGTHE